MSRTFSPTIRSSMWSTIPTPWRMPISAARLEVDRHDLRLVGSQLAPRHELEHIVVGRVREVLDPLALRRAPPEVVVDRVRRALGAALDRDPVLARVGDLLVAPHRPGAHRSDHLEL